MGVVHDISRGLSFIRWYNYFLVVLLEESDGEGDGVEQRDEVDPVVVGGEDD